jgi:hypothetical protein
MTMATPAAILDTPPLSTSLAAPVILADTGLSADQVLQLVMKVLYAGEASGLAVADTLRLPFTILEPLIERARAQQLIKVRGATGTGSAT